jgi:hypothetical protein
MRDRKMKSLLFIFLSDIFLFLEHYASSSRSKNLSPG